jgi:hypothetical protein
MSFLRRDICKRSRNRHENFLTKPNRQRCTKTGGQSNEISSRSRWSRKAGLVRFTCSWHRILILWICRAKKAVVYIWLHGRVQTRTTITCEASESMAIASRDIRSSLMAWDDRCWGYCKSWAIERITQKFSRLTQPSFVPTRSDHHCIR